MRELLAFAASYGDGFRLCDLGKKMTTNNSSNESGMVISTTEKLLLMTVKAAIIAGLVAPMTVQLTMMSV